MMNTSPQHNKGNDNKIIGEQPFKRGDWRRPTKEELIKYKSNFDSLRKALEGWYFSNNSEWIEENNSEGKSRLILASKDDNGNWGVDIGCDIDLTV